MKYNPPFTVTSKAIHLVAEISAQIERYAIRLERDDALLLRKVNRIKSIHSSLAIEGNNLSEREVSDIINGKPVVAPVKEIQEVKNAIKAYNEYPLLNPYAVDDLLKAHSLMMEALIDDPGRFRRGGVGVVAGSTIIHMAPPAERVPYLVKDLFAWLHDSEDHLLIKSCVFHYEFEFIHPFSDGNGRMGRLWQSLILGSLHPLFEHLPVENIVYANQQAYYDSINQSSARGDSGVFIEFMLQEILTALKHRQGDSLTDVGVNVGVNEMKALDLIRQNAYLTAKEIAQEIGLSDRQGERIVAALKKKGYIRRQGAAKTGYWEVIKK